MRMPNQCTERNTSMANATVNDKSPVGERRPGTRPVRLAAAMNSQRVPMKGSSRAAWSAPRPRWRLAVRAPFPPARLQARGRLGAQPRVPRKAKPASNAMRSQVVSTVAPTCNGPISKASSSSSSGLPMIGPQCRLM